MRLEDEYYFIGVYDNMRVYHNPYTCETVIDRTNDELKVELTDRERKGLIESGLVNKINEMFYIDSTYDRL
ncbi:MAG: hypothetical protein KJ847_01755 [Firmicutes bacterium]|nr:hypothetical protein [Bacillota bacterium]